MNAEQSYIAIAVLAIFGLTILLSRRLLHKQARGLTPLAGLSFGFILAGIVFGEERLLGYGLMGIGIVLSIIDIFNQRRHDHPRGSSETPS